MACSRLVGAVVRPARKGSSVRDVRCVTWCSSPLPTSRLPLALCQTTKDRMWAAVSTATVVGWLTAYVAAGASWVYVLPWLVFHAWLFTVTYLQHHNGEDTKVRLSPAPRAAQPGLPMTFFF
jgi:fatty acid desaturase